jgi:hypothetical protein
LVSDKEAFGASSVVVVAEVFELIGDVAPWGVPAAVAVLVNWPAATFAAVKV